MKAIPLENDVHYRFKVYCVTRRLLMQDVGRVLVEAGVRFNLIDGAVQFFERVASEQGIGEEDVVQYLMSLYAAAKEDEE